MSEPGSTDKAKDAMYVDPAPGQTDEEAIAEMILKPSTSAGLLATRFSLSANELQIFTVAAALQKKAEKAASGDLSGMEQMLAMQAHSLDAIFNKLAYKAALNINAGHLGAGDTYLRLALKAQGQSRATAETLAEMKNPRSVAFIRQANVAHGAQQVNNGVPQSMPAAPAHVRNPEQTNELLEHSYGERLDTGAQAQAGRAHQTLEAVGEIDRPRDLARQGAKRAERHEARGTIKGSHKRAEGTQATDAEMAGRPEDAVRENAA